MRAGIAETTVSQIAQAHGLSHAGRFAVTDAQLFGAPTRRPCAAGRRARQATGLGVRRGVDRDDRA